VKVEQQLTAAIMFEEEENVALLVQPMGERATDIFNKRKDEYCCSLIGRYMIDSQGRRECVWAPVKKKKFLDP
jgi:hypothetical protein